MDWLEMLDWDQNEIEDIRYAAYTYLKQGAYDVSLTFFNALSILSPDAPYDLETLGAVHLQLGSGMKALDYLDRSLKLEPENLLAKLNRAKALFMLGYKKQGLLQAQNLEKCDDPEIAMQASALVLAYNRM
jgi:predicted Zn-dependent protease